MANRYPVVGQLSPWHLLVVRLAIASLTLAPLLVRVRRLARVPAARAGAFLYLQPLISVLGGSLLLGERVGLSTLLGGALILAGVALAQVPAVASTR